MSINSARYSGFSTTATGRAHMHDGAAQHQQQQWRPPHDTAAPQERIRCRSSLAGSTPSFIIPRRTPGGGPVPLALGKHPQHGLARRHTIMAPAGMPPCAPPPRAHVCRTTRGVGGRDSPMAVPTPHIPSGHARPWPVLLHRPQHGERGAPHHRAIGGVDTRSGLFCKSAIYSGISFISQAVPLKNEIKWL